MEKNNAGIDIGGTNLRCGILGEGGTVKSRLSVSFPKSLNEAEKQVDFIIGNVKQFLSANEKYGVKSIGVGIAGQIDDKTGSVLFSPNLNWHEVPLKYILEKETGLDVYIANDLTAITFGEWKFGSGKGEDNIICIFVGTGIGSGIIIDGSLYSGCSNASGEIGHITIVSGGRKCTCGNYGCLEAYAGGLGIANIAKERAAADINGFKNIINAAGGGIDGISAETVADAYKAGDKKAAELIRETGVYLSDGVISAINLLNPCVIILGGGVINGIPGLYDTVKNEVGKRALKASISKLRILKSGLGGEAGIIGAAGLAAMHAMHCL
ncbi:MAG: ROK family protein [Deltaproteobacteria bacterium]|jgi:glucokinase|nr:ROK family protein [Deltaproteobacteria bacterium]